MNDNMTNELNPTYQIYDITIASNNLMILKIELLFARKM